MAWLIRGCTGVLAGIAYVARTIRLTLLAPDIIEAVMAGQCPPGLTLKRVSREFSVDWDEQRRVFGNA